jgi:hypothetical protein
MAHPLNIQHTKDHRLTYSSFNDLKYFRLDSKMKITCSLFLLTVYTSKGLWQFYVRFPFYGGWVIGHVRFEGYLCCWIVPSTCWHKGNSSDLLYVHTSLELRTWTRCSDEISISPSSKQMPVKHLSVAWDRFLLHTARFLVHNSPTQYKWILCHHSMACCQVVDGGDSLQMWRVAASTPILYSR